MQSLRPRKLEASLMEYGRSSLHDLETSVWEYGVEAWHDMSHVEERLLAYGKFRLQVSWRAGQAFWGPVVRRLAVS